MVEDSRTTDPGYNISQSGRVYRPTSFCICWFFLYFKPFIDLWIEHRPSLGDWIQFKIMTIDTINGQWFLKVAVVVVGIGLSTCHSKVWFNKFQYSRVI